MPTRLLVSLVLILSIFLTTSAKAELKLGDPAPPIKVSKFIKGTPLNSFEPGKVYVMEFWATWCGPCIAAIPHITELQEKYREQGVTVMGTSVWERDAEQSKVVPFVKEQGDRMNYIVAMDDRTDGGPGAMATTWLEAAGQNGIPASFIVDQKGRVVWIGHPMELEPVLKEVLAGTFDAEKHASQANELKQLQHDFMEAAQAGDWDKLITLCDQGAEKYPELASQMIMSKFQIQLTQKKDTTAAYATAEEIVNGDDAMNINGVAWIIATAPNVEPRNLDLALRASEKAVELSKWSDPTMIDTLARVHFVKGDIDKAIELETKAVEMASGSLKDELQTALDEFKSARK